MRRQWLGGFESLTAPEALSLFNSRFSNQHLSIRNYSPVATDRRAASVPPPTHRLASASFVSMLARVFTLLLAAASAVLADVAITSPTGGSTVANTALSVALSGASGMNVQVQVVAGGQKSDLSDSVSKAGSASGIIA